MLISMGNAKGLCKFLMSLCFCHHTIADDIAYAPQTRRCLCIFVDTPMASRPPKDLVKDMTATSQRVWNPVFTLWIRRGDVGDELRWLNALCVTRASFAKISLQYLSRSHFPQSLDLSYSLPLITFQIQCQSLCTNEKSKVRQQQAQLFREQSTQPAH